LDFDNRKVQNKPATSRIFEEEDMPPETSEPISPQTAPAEAAESAQEVDVWWGGYAWQTMLPDLGICLLVTAGLIGLAYFLVSRFDLRPEVARWISYYLNVLLWLLGFLRLAYRLAAYEYRLTKRRVFCSRGPLFGPTPPVELAEVQSVRVEQSALQRWLGVGTIVVTAANRPEPLVLAGVADPERIAKMIRRA
jgi:hypothetical protein